MSFEPQKFFIGLVDFFSILMPGALLSYFVKDDVGRRLLGDQYAKLAGTEGWICFLFSSYLVGHFIFLFGSWLFDEGVYDKIREATYTGQIRRLAKGKKLSTRIARWVAPHYIRPISDHAVRQAERIKERYLGKLNASAAINAFQWCKARLAIKHPEPLAAVHRFEADSKFFRSLLVVLGLLLFWGLIHKQPALTLTAVLLLPMAFWRYVDQRVKASNQAYWYIITLEANPEANSQESTPPPAKVESHAGGVVFNQVGKDAKYLLLRAKDAPEEWVLPKGHIEPTETTQETAVREVREEAGVWARVKRALGPIEYHKKGELVNAEFYLMECLEEGKPMESRKHDWFSFEESVRQATHVETKDLLRLAEKHRTAL